MAARMRRDQQAGARASLPPKPSPPASLSGRFPIHSEEHGACPVEECILCLIAGGPQVELLVPSDHHEADALCEMAERRGANWMLLELDFKAWKMAAERLSPFLGRPWGKYEWYVVAAEASAFKHLADEDQKGRFSPAFVADLIFLLRAWGAKFANSSQAWHCKGTRERYPPGNWCRRYDSVDEMPEDVRRESVSAWPRQK